MWMMKLSNFETCMMGCLHAIIIVTCLSRKSRVNVSKSSANKTKLLKIELIKKRLTSSSITDNKVPFT